MMITDTGTIIRTPVSGIPSRSRSAGGVIVMRLGEGQTLVNFTKVAREDEKDADVEGAEDVLSSPHPKFSRAKNIRST